MCLESLCFLLKVINGFWSFIREIPPQVDLGTGIRVNQ